LVSPKNTRSRATRELGARDTTVSLDIDDSFRSVDGISIFILILNNNN